MIEIYIDGALAHSTAADDEAHIALNVRPTLDIEDSGSLSFVLPPGNAQYDAIRKMKSIVTLYQDGVLLFRGRVTESERDNFNQKTVHCEGDRAFLNDSLWEEQTFSGTAADLFRQLIANHNGQVDAEKRFTVGTITAVESYTTIEDDQQINTRRLTDTASVIEDRLLSMFGGYLRTRTQDGVTYIDWLKDFTEESSQTISFSVNLLDLTEKMDASSVFTVLIPLGYSEIGEDGTYEDPVNITSVNGGKEYIENAEAVALYGRIWRSKTWGNTKDPAQLLEKGWEYLRTGMELRTLEIKAVDMHLTDAEIAMIRIGTKVHIASDPHGIDLHMVCAKIDPDYDKPENTTFTFGVKPKTLTEAVIRNEKDTNSLTGKGRGGGGGGGGKSVKEELEEIFRWATITAEKEKSLISLNAGLIDKTQMYMSAAGIDINGELAQVKVLATKETTDALTGRVSRAESSIEVNADNIQLKVSKDGVVSAINQSAEAVKISAGRIDLSGYVTASQLSSLEADLAKITSGTVQASHLYTQNLTATNTVRLSGHTCSWESLEVVTGVSLSKSYQNVPGGNGVTYTVIGGVSASVEKEEIKFLGR